ncbi:MAG: hypothetical protein K6U87_01820 [Firmicutes bacterium]|nr:hypothetical protein [Bacillota bacterium]
MADAIQLEKRGIPAAAICTNALRASADAMAKVQGFPGFRYAVIEHPVSNLGVEELRARAQQALPQVLEILLAPSREP